MFDWLNKYANTYAQAAKDLETFLRSAAWEAFIEIKFPLFKFGVSDIPLGYNGGVALYLHPRFACSALPCSNQLELLQLLYGVHGRLHRYAPNKSDPAMLLSYIILSMQADVTTMLTQIEARCGRVDTELTGYARKHYGELNAILACASNREVKWPESGVKRLFLRACITWFW